MAADDLGVVDADQVDGGARAAADLLDRPVVPVQAPHANRPAGGLPLELVADRDAARGDRPGHDRPMPGHGERAVDRHPEQARGRSPAGTASQADCERGLELSQALPR